MTHHLKALIAATAATAALVLVPQVLARTVGDRAGAVEPKSAPAADGTSRLDGFLGFGRDPVADERQFNKDLVQRQELLATCMRNAGFEYYPTPPGTAVVMTLDGEFQIGPPAGAGEAAERRNDKYVAGLSPSQVPEYWSVRHGYPHNNEGFTSAEVAMYDANGDGNVSLEEAGPDSCIVKAEKAVPGVFHAANLIGADVDQLQRDSESAINASGAPGRLVECIQAHGPKVSGRSLPNYMADHPAVRDSTAIRQCVASFKTEADAQVVEIENRFYDEHREVIDKWGIRSSNS